MFQRSILVAIFIIGIVLSPVLSAQLYKWVDEKGQVHYGDKPPADAKSETLRPPPPVGSGEEAAQQHKRLEQAVREMESREEERRKEALDRKAAKVARKDSKNLCLALRRELDVLDSGLPVYRDEIGQFRVQWKSDPYQGERRYLQENEKRIEIERVRSEIAVDCGNPDDPKARRLAREQQVSAEQCEARKADLEQLRRPQSKASDDKIEAQRRLVAAVCKN